MILRYALTASCIAALLAPAIPASGQTVGAASGSIVGTVMDATGARLSGVLVSISSDALMGRRTTVTAADGSYRVAALPPGEYELSFSSSGFSTRVEEIRVAVGFTSTLDVQLDLATLRERVTVGSRRSVLDRQSTSLGQSFDARQLVDLPFSRSMGGLLATAHGVQLSEFEVGGTSGILNGPQTAYGRNSSPRHTVEGIIVTGLFGFGFTPDYGSFEEAAVLTGAHGAEWPTPGIHTQVVTRSGGNRYRGTLYADYENRRWQSFNVDDDQSNRLSLRDGGLPGREANRLWAYRDANADGGGFVVKDRLWWYSSLRNQEISSRLVNFPVQPHRTRLTSYGGKATYRIAPRHSLVVYGQRALNHQPTRLDPFGPGGGGLRATTAINEAEGSTANQRNAGWVWKGQWDAVPRDVLLLELRGGQFGVEQAWTPRSADPRFEDVETLLVRGGNRDWRGHVRRNQAFAALSYFIDGPAGRHHLKAGGDIIRFLVRERWLSGYPGNVLHVLQSGRPSSVFLFDTPSESEAGLWTFSAYAADSWQPASRLTLNLGLRVDRYRVFLPAQEHPAGSPAAVHFPAVPNLIDWNTAVPRVGLAYDLTGEGRTLVKVAFARYHIAPNAELAFNSNPNSSEWWRRFEWTDADGSGVWEPGEEGRNLGRRGGIAVESLDPALRLPMVNEAAAWLERELPAGIAVRSGLIWRGARHHLARQNVSQPFDAFTMPVLLPDPGPDGVRGSADDGPVVQAYDLRPEYATLRPLNIVANVPGARTEYWTWEIVATRRLRGRWSFGGGFAQTWNRDHAQSYAGQALRNNTYPLTPNDLINTAEGGSHHFATWSAKAHGTYEAPWGIRVSPVLRHQSGQPFGRTFTADRTQLRYATVTILAEPVGTRRTDHITLLDVRAEKSVRVGGTRLTGFIDVFNLFNANPEQNVIWSSGASFLKPVSIVSPRIARIGAKFDW